MKLTIKKIFWMDVILILFDIGHKKEWINTKKDLKPIYGPLSLTLFNFLPLKNQLLCTACTIYIKTTQQKMRELVFIVIFVQLTIVLLIVVFPCSII